MISDVLRYMLDTSVCIRIQAERPAALLDKFNAEADSLCLSTVALYELLFGAEKSARPVANRKAVEGLAARLDVLPSISAAAAHTADIRATLQKRGMPIDPYDLMIAGHARSRGLTVVTGNLGEFRRVDGLQSEDWFAAPIQ